MPTTAEVKHALKQGDRKRAMQLLKQVLKENPSAEAWYLAAKATSDKENAIKHLRRGLTIDPKHTRSRDMLHELGGDKKRSTSHLLEEIHEEMLNFGQDSRIFGPIFGRLSPSQRVIGVSVMFAVIIMVFCAVSMNVLFPPPPAPEQIAIAPTEVVVHIQAQTLINHFQSSALSLDSIESAPISPEETEPISFYPVRINEKYLINVADANGSHEVTMYVYESTQFLNYDLPRLEQYFPDSGIVSNQHIAVIYPASLDGNAVTALQETLGSIPFS